MKISEEGLTLIKQFEGFRNHPYQDSVGVWTIGYGFTYYPCGGRVKKDDTPVTKKEANELLRQLIEPYEDAVNKNVTSEITQNQFDALVSFTYNLGEGNLKSSTLLKKVNNDPCDPTITDEFKKWKYAGGVELKGLKKRRNSEAYHYFS